MSIQLIISNNDANCRTEGFIFDPLSQLAVIKSSIMIYIPPNDIILDIQKLTEAKEHTLKDPDH